MHYMNWSLNESRSFQTSAEFGGSNVKLFPLNTQTLYEDRKLQTRPSFASIMLNPGLKKSINITERPKKTMNYSWKTSNYRPASEVKDKCIGGIVQGQRNNEICDLQKILKIWNLQIQYTCTCNWMVLHRREPQSRLRWFWWLLSGSQVLWLEESASTHSRMGQGMFPSLA